MILGKLVFWWLHRQYKKYGQPIFYSKGTGKEFSKYLLYTENPDVYRRMDEF
jgi:hypothetical protein